MKFVLQRYACLFRSLCFAIAVCQLLRCTFPWPLGFCSEHVFIHKLSIQHLRHPIFTLYLLARHS
jgi:hypothetical protein